MRQYKELLHTILNKGTRKPAARENMPGTISLFGYQFRHNLGDGFPLLTTKKINFKNIVIELLWFLRGDTNIKYLVDNGVNIWNEDAYNYYVKIASANTDGNAGGLYMKTPHGYRMFFLHEFVNIIQNCEIVDADNNLMKLPTYGNYTLGDCGYQYGRVWRKFGVNFYKDINGDYKEWAGSVDQIKNLITGLKNNPEGRRHIVTSIDPLHDTDLALYWCHAMFQFNCRPLTDFEVYEVAGVMYDDWKGDKNVTVAELHKMGYPKYYLDCQMYQRSADVFLGVPYNIASYALLTHIIAKMCNMIPGEFIHTFGDVHIYENHIDQVTEQLGREERGLPTLTMSDIVLNDIGNLDSILKVLSPDDFTIHNYNPHPPIKAELSTGLVKN